MSSRYGVLTPDQREFLSHGTCSHAVTVTSHIPDSDVHIVHCENCNSEIERYYGDAPLP